ncbi:myo-inosose-2 dehydratase [Holdemania massiliensis]|uniref:Inosose dehydratase n=1 Tax=Holdemania massiliensis TaxID=1468449 RepID=A0A6N7S6U5_9FIRM|nr:myo-inosose-2 dehydratase [Holdemania massiliensis]MSA70776.1 myo-inosose-2 dehydratase [Holdemania massiliensis]MSA89026.1 myo-inosose-2 dehydratase [Holdemania massiliensis]MSB77855.1 myo-inosose-2 dehydratase [Holdemania massiliensis]MSC32780.1 myo-inosose-2 dehydratase [Holdemania massiliensis]MSC39101.1 myo-inosose-2 dehydratase [Holdemania massiliensis]
MKLNHVKIGIAPIAWTNDDMPDLGRENTFEQCISEMALAGYAGCEIGNQYPRDPEVLEKALKLRGLQICNAWFSTYFTRGQKAETIAKFIEHRDFLHALGAKVIGISEQGNSIQGTTLPIFDAKPVYTQAQWQAVIEGFEELAALAAEKDMKLGVHHHMGTGVQTEAEIDYLMEHTSNQVGLLYDCGHLYYSEGTQEAVMRVLEKHINRVVHVHLKDVRPAILEKVRCEKLSFLEGVRAGSFTVPSDGVISFEPIFACLAQHQYEGWMVVEAEQDPAKANPLEYAIKARTFIREKTGC